MRDVIQLVFFLLVLNIFLGITGELVTGKYTSASDLTDYQTQLEEVTEFQSNLQRLNISNVQREEASDLAPPIKTWTLAQSWISVLKKGIFLDFTVLDDGTASLAEKMGLNGLKLYIGLSYFLCAWMIIKVFIVKDSKTG